MQARALTCLAEPGAASRPIHVVRPDGLAAFLDSLPPGQRSWLQQAGFTAAAGERPVLLPGEGVAGAVLGIGEDLSHFAFGDLAASLPAGTWRLEPGDYEPNRAVLGFCLGAYVYDRFRTSKRLPVKLVVPENCMPELHLAETIWLVRDLINTPANALGPTELAEAARVAGVAAGATVEIIEGAELDDAYPAIASVGRAAARPPRVVVLHWCGSTAAADAPLVSLCGKGVVFDTGGLDLKPSSAMLRMKKDMGGAAIMLGVARVLMQRDLPIRLALRLGCVENSVSGSAMRPGDVLATRAGLTVEVGNTDAEGRLVLADLLADACSESPAVLIDCATLTGAARVATGPDLPALFSNNDEWAARMTRAGDAVHDPVWRLPLWSGYDSWLSSPVADMNNVSSKPFAGAIVAALFLQRFVAGTIPWLHIDAYAWNDSNRPARPEGGEAQALRTVVSAIEARFCPEIG